MCCCVTPCRLAENTLLDLHWVGWQHGLPSSSPRCQDLIDTELVSRLAKVASDAVDLQTEVVPFLNICMMLHRKVLVLICFKSWSALGVYDLYNVTIWWPLFRAFMCVL